MAKQAVLLEIVYDENEYDPPSNWDWAELLDVPDGHDVQVGWASDPIDMSEQTD